MLATALAAFSISLAIFPHETRAIAFLSSSPQLSPQAHEENQMRSLKSIGQKSLGVLSSLAIAAGASAQDAMQWRVEDGGNGHWYQVVVPANQTTAPEAHSRAAVFGGYLATLTTQLEMSWVAQFASGFPSAWANGNPEAGAGPLLGGIQQPGSRTNEGWSWVSGEPWSFSAWGQGEPNDAGECTPHVGREDYLAFITATAWNDVQSDRECYYGWLVPSFIIEWSADCNADGIVDYGQIRAGELEDANGNNIPDCCEQSTSCEPCAADIDGSGTVNAVDLAAILTVWGTDGGKYPRADINGDGEVNGPDLAAVLSNWGSCP
jgi:hypothetical protein